MQGMDVLRVLGFDSSNATIMKRMRFKSAWYFRMAHAVDVILQNGRVALRRPSSQSPYSFKCLCPSPSSKTKPFKFGAKRRTLPRRMHISIQTTRTFLPCRQWSFELPLLHQCPFRAEPFGACALFTMATTPNHEKAQVGAEVKKIRSFFFAASIRCDNTSNIGTNGS
jgi:hypothetical protein